MMYEAIASHEYPLQAQYKVLAKVREMERVNELGTQLHT